MRLRTLGRRKFRYRFRPRTRRRRSRRYFRLRNHSNRYNRCLGFPKHLRAEVGKFRLRRTRRQGSCHGCNRLPDCKFDSLLVPGCRNYRPQGLRTRYRFERYRVPLGFQYHSHLLLHAQKADSWQVRPLRARRQTASQRCFYNKISNFYSSFFLTSPFFRVSNRLFFLHSSKNQILKSLQPCVCFASSYDRSQVCINRILVRNGFGLPAESYVISLQKLPYYSENPTDCIRIVRNSQPPYFAPPAPAPGKVNLPLADVPPELSERKYSSWALLNVGSLRRIASFNLAETASL